MDKASYRAFISEDEQFLVLQEFPTPIATACKDLWDIMSKEDISSSTVLEACENAFESLLRFFAWTVTSDYLDSKEDWPNINLNRIILKFINTYRQSDRDKTSKWKAFFMDVLCELLHRPSGLFVVETKQLKGLDWEDKGVDEFPRSFHNILKSVSFLRYYYLLATLHDQATAPDTVITVVFRGTEPYEEQISLQPRCGHQEIKSGMTYIVNARNQALRLTPLFSLHGGHSICTFVEAIGRGYYLFDPGRFRMTDKDSLELMEHCIDAMMGSEDKSCTETDTTDPVTACEKTCDDFFQRNFRYRETPYQHRDVQETISTFLEKGPTPLGEPFSEPVMVVVGESGVGKSMLLCNLLANRHGKFLTLAYIARDIKEGVVAAIMKSLKISGEYNPRTLLKDLDAFRRERPDVFGREKPLSIFVDGLNEADNPEEVFKSIHALASLIEDRPIRILLTSRSPIWRKICRGRQNLNAEFDDLYCQSGSDNGDSLPYALKLQPFSPHELEKAYVRYCSQEQLSLPPFGELSREWKALLRSPIYLSLIARQGKLPDVVSQTNAIEHYIGSCVDPRKRSKKKEKEVLLSKMQEILMRLGQLMLEHHCLCLEPASSGKAIEEAVYDILHNHEEPYALAIDLGIIVEGGKRLGDDLKICFAHEQFTEYYFAEVLRSELDQILVPPYARAQMWAKHMVEHLANTHMIAVLSGAFVMLISTLEDTFVELLLRSLASYSAPEISEVVVQSLVRRCEQNWSNGECILRALMAGSPQTNPFILRKVMDSLKKLLVRDVAVQDRAKIDANTFARCRRAAVEATTRIEGNQSNAFLIDALRNRSAAVRNFAVDLVSGRWCVTNAEKRNVKELMEFLDDLTRALEFPMAGIIGTLWHAFKERFLLQSCGRFLFSLYVEDVQDTGRNRQILECCQRILRKVRPSLLPKLSRLLVSSAFLVIKRFSVFPIRSISILWDEPNVKQTRWLVDFIDPETCPAPDKLRRIDEILLTGGRDTMRLGMRWLAITAYSSYTVNKPEEAAQHFRQLHERGDEFVRWYLLVPATFGWQGNKSPALKNFVEETCWRIMTEWREDMYLAESPWFTCGTPLTPLSVFSWRVTERPRAPLLIFRRAMEEFCSKQENASVTMRLFEDITPLLLAVPEAVVPTLITYAELLYALPAGAESDKEVQWRPVVNRFCESLATLRLSNSRAFEDFLDEIQPPVSFTSQLQQTNPNPKYLAISQNMRLGTSTQRLLITSNDLSRWFLRAIQAVDTEESMRKHVAHFVADMVKCLQTGSLAQSDFFTSNIEGQP